MFVLSLLKLDDLQGIQRSKEEFSWSKWSFFEFFLFFGVLSSKKMYHYLNDCSRLVVQLQQGVGPGTPRFWRSLKDS
jgi:hypothetical protein